MALAEDVPSATAPQLRRRAVPLSFITALALSIGVISEGGKPGSIIALPLAVIALCLLASARKKGVRLWQTGLAPATVLSWVAVLLQPGLLALLMHWFCLVSLVLASQRLPINHVSDVDSVTGWAASLTRTPLAIIQDTVLATGVRELNRRRPHLLAVTNLVLPAFAFAVFAALLAIANPMMESLLQGRFDRVLTGWILPVSLAAFVLLTTVNSARPVAWQPSWDRELPDTHWRSVFLNPTSLTTTLVLLNGLFAVQNLFDFTYVWLDGQLPPGLTHAQYVHRGSYTLIATAMLAALLILFALRKGSATAASPIVRKLVYLWLAQNMLLVASSAARTLSYVDDYGMTLWRLSGLIWMALVATGLLLVAVRVLTGRGNEWLTNANLAVSFVVLLGCALVDLRFVVAEWNATVALGRPTWPLDETYLNELGPSALPALIRLAEARRLTNHLNCTARQTDRLFTTTPFPFITGPLIEQQSHWQSFTLLDARYQQQLKKYALSCNPPPLDR